MFIVRQGATHKVVLGPAVAVGDGFTPVTTLSLGGADDAEVILHDNITVVDISAYTMAAVGTADGYYQLTLQSGISNTVGHMTVIINDDSLILPLRADFTIVEEAVYDAMYATSAGGPLQSTAVGRKLDVSTGGEAGIDWANVGTPGSTVALTATTVDTTTNNTDMVGTNSAALASVVGALADSASADEVTSADTLMQYIKQLINILIGTPGIGTLKPAAAPASGVSLSEMIRGIYDDRTLAAAGYASPTNITAGTITTVSNATCVAGTAAFFQDFFTVDSGEVSSSEVSGSAILEIAKVVWDRVLSKANHDVSQSAGKRLRQIDAAFEVHSGTARVTSTSTTIDLELATADNTTDEIYAGDRCVIVAGTGVGEHGLIISYNSTTQVATMSKAWVIPPDASSEYILVPADCDVEMWNDNTVTGDGDWATLASEVTAIKVPTDKMVFTTANQLDVNALALGSQTVTAAAGITIHPVVGAATIVATKAQMDTAHGLLATPAQVATEISDALITDTHVAGKTIADAINIISAVVAGQISGADTATEIFTDFADTTKVTVTVDSSGNRTEVVYA